MFKFERLEVWRRSVGLYEEIVVLTEKLPRLDQMSLGEQLRRAALSVSTNIAEGTGREGAKESKHFFNIAKGSVYEVVSLLEVMRRRRYVGNGDFQAIYDKCDELAKMLSGLIR